MSSRRLLALIKRLPHDGAFKTALSDDWPLQAQLTTGVWNEIKAMRSDLYALIAQEKMTYKPVLPPSAQREQAEKRSKIRSAHDETLAQLRGN